MGAFFFFLTAVLYFNWMKRFRGDVIRLQSAHPLRGLLRQHVILLSELQLSLFRRRSVQSGAASIAHSVQRIVLQNRQNVFLLFLIFLLSELRVTLFTLRIRGIQLLLYILTQRHIFCSLKFKAIYLSIMKQFA